MIDRVAHPMVRLQNKVRSLVEARVLAPEDGLWKIAFLYGDKWQHWKQELLEFEFSLQDPIRDLLAVDTWEEEE